MRSQGASSGEGCRFGASLLVSVQIARGRGCARERASGARLGAPVVNVMQTHSGMFVLPAGISRGKPVCRTSVQCGNCKEVPITWRSCRTVLSPLHRLAPRAHVRHARWATSSYRHRFTRLLSSAATPQRRVGFVGGAGNMGSAIIRGIVGSGFTAPHLVHVSGRDRAKLERLAADTAVQITTDNAKMLSQVDVLFLCVKPAQIESLLHQLFGTRPPSLLIVSVAAGASFACLERWIQDASATANEPRLIRCMPNVPLQVGCGATGLSRGRFATDADLAWTQALFESIGTVALVDEPLLDAVVAVAGSATAFMFQFLEALSDAGVREGLPRPTARALAVQAMRGAARMAQAEPQAHLAELRNRVESPGGTTIAGTLALEAADFRAAVQAAAAASAAKSRALRSAFEERLMGKE